jgi:hypothetical protein
MALIDDIRELRWKKSDEGNFKEADALDQILGMLVEREKGRPEALHSYQAGYDDGYKDGKAYDEEGWCVCGCNCC